MTTQDYKNATVRLNEFIDQVKVYRAVHFKNEIPELISTSTAKSLENVYKGFNRFGRMISSDSNITKLKPEAFIYDGSGMVCSGKDHEMETALSVFQAKSLLSWLDDHNYKDQVQEDQNNYLKIWKKYKDMDPCGECVMYVKYT